MAEALFHYSGKDMILTFGEVLFEGYGDDVFAMIEPNEDDTDLVVGVDGQTTRTMNNNESAVFEVTLSASSPTNPLLSVISKLDRRTGQGVRPFLIKDPNGNDLFLAARSWIKRRPRREWGKKPGSRVWRFETNSLTDFDGGSNAPPLPA